MGNFQNNNYQSRNRDNYSNRPTDDVEIDWESNELFSMVAKKISDKLKDEKMNKHQLRKFYNEVLRIENDIARTQFEENIPYINMINAKASYAKSRRTCGESFVSFIKKGISFSKNKECFLKFRKLFEAIVAYYG